MDRLLEATARVEVRHFWFVGLRRYARALLDRSLGVDHSRMILDCGSGTGYNLTWLPEYGWAMGVELSETGLALSREGLHRLARATVTRLPCPDASFDLVTSFDVLYSLSDDDEAVAIREMWRVLKPGGVALVNVAALDILRGSHSVLANEVRRYSKASLRAKLGAAGFRVERITSTNLSTLPLVLAVRLAQRLRGTATAADESEIRTPRKRVNRALTRLLEIEAWWVRRGIRLPVGSSIMCVARKPR